MNLEIRTGAKKKSFFRKIKRWFLERLKLTDRPVIKLYTGYGNQTHCYLYGHAFSFGPIPRKKYRSNILLNSLALIRLFMVRPKKAALLQFVWLGVIYNSQSENDGFFKFEWKPDEAPVPGSHHVHVNMLDGIDGDIIATAKAIMIIPENNQFAFISDIDDTFLISHSSNLRKRLFVLLTENALSRKPFEGVVNHYQLLARAQAPDNTRNPFFYVSSSEWNLYDYIRDFSSKQQLPEGVYLLNQVKKISQVFRTGQNNHSAKFMRISRVLEAYPGHRFILLGDDSQEDPIIYASVVEHFSNQVFCIYIRKVTGKSKPEVEEKLNWIEKNGIPYCYFAHSAEAVIHSKKIGLITEI